MYKCFDSYGNSNSLQACKYVVLEYARDLVKLTNALNDECLMSYGLDTFAVDSAEFPTAVEWNSLNCCWHFVSFDDCPIWLKNEIVKNETNSHKKEEVKIMYECFDEKGKGSIIDTCDYILINDYDKLLFDCTKMHIITDGLEDAYEIAEQKCPFVVKMDRDSYVWEYCSFDDCPTWLTKQITEEVENESAIHESTNTKEKLYNLYVVFKTDITLQTNTEPVTLEEIIEAIEVLQKPSIFGKQIAEFKIEVL